MLFTWHDAKPVSNRRKHGIAFADAAQVFDDPFAVAGHDRIEHGERRWLIAGLIVVVVAYTLQESGEDEIIRLISARQATRRERIHYAQNRQKNTQ